MGILKKLLIWILFLLAFAVITALFTSLYIIPILPILIAAFYFWLTKTHRDFIKKESVPIYQLTEGLVKIQGTISAENRMVTPYFKEECIGFYYEEGEIWYDDDGDERVTKAKIEKDFLPFYVSNFTGRIKVNPEGIDLSLLPAKTESINLIRHTERTLKNGEEIVILGTVVKNDQHQFELQKEGTHAFKVTVKDKIQRDQKAFMIIGFLTPYLIMMYLAVNYFLFFDPIKIHIEKNTAFTMFSLFGVPLLGAILGVVSNKSEGFLKTCISILAGIFFFVSILSFPILCLTLLLKIEFYRIMCIWASIFVFTSLGMLINYNKLRGITFDEDND